ncbi:MAG TPA: DUF2961 domain-containing protein [Candidatus Hydrogenedentes bacterium]|nr:DUF2961 domain-containing protein [Candidatus Hydrogenedentota bacterium]
MNRIALPALASFLLLMVPAVAAPSRGGWLELIDTTQLPVLRLDQCQQVSSYDRTGGNNDGFEGTYSALREEDGAFVIFEETGPGCIYRIWSADPGARRMEFYFDGETSPRLVFDKWEEMFQNKVPPFVEPFSRIALGAGCSYVPIPYKKSLKIVTRQRVHFYQITFQKFAKGFGVSSFSPKVAKRDKTKMDRVAAAWNHLGAHPWPEAIKSVFSPTDVTVEPGKTAVLAERQGAGVLHLLELTIAAKDPKWLRKTVLRVTVDGAARPHVECPVGDFFMQPFPGEEVKSLLVGKRGDDQYYSFWPMPFASGITVELVNESNAPVSVNTQWGGESMRSLPKNMGRFHATWRRLDPVPDGELYPILNAKGRGHWCGMSAAMQGHGPGLGFLEGDEMLWIDDRDNTAYNGTGTEDYYNGGWYFGRTGHFPFYGCGYLSDPEGRCHAFRLHMTDLVPFQRQARIGIEHGPDNHYPADYAGTVFWYGAPETVADAPEMKPVAQRLWRPGRLAGHIEAEDAVLVLQPPAAILEDADRDAFFSAGKAVMLPEGAKTAFHFAVEEEDVYEAVVHFASGLGPAKANVTLNKDETQWGDISVQPEGANGMAVSVETARLRKGPNRLTIRAAQGDLGVDAFMLKPSVKVAGVQEAEKAAFKARGGAKVSVVDGRVAGASGGSFVAVSGKGDRAGVNFDFTTQEAGAHRVSVRLLQGPEGGAVKLAVDGEALGDLVHCHSEVSKWTDAFVAGITGKLLPGKHSLTLLNADNNAAIMGIDYFQALPATKFEAETLKVLEVQGGRVEVQPMEDFGSGWSGGAQCFFINECETGALALEVLMPSDGRRKVSVFYAQAPDYGMFQCSVDGVPLGQPFNGYAATVRRADRVDYGEVELSEGAHIFRFECTGKDPASTARFLGIDLVVIE